VPAGDPQLFNFNRSWGADFQLDDDDPIYDSDWTLTPGGPFSVSEDLPAGWSQTSAVCTSSLSGVVDPASFMLVAGEQVDCVFTNTRLARVTVDKVTAPAGDPQLFNFNRSWGADFQLDDDDPIYDSDWTLTPGGPFSVSEDLPGGWSQTSAVCTSSLSGVVDPAGFMLAAGEQVDCVFTNTKACHIIVDKVTLPAGDPQSFEFDPSWSDANFLLTDAGGTYESGPLTAGLVYSVVEVDLPAGWSATSATCSGDDDGTSPASIQLDPGEVVTCTFTNSKAGRIIVNKVTPADAPAGSFVFDPSWGLDFVLAGGGSHDSGLLQPGVYSVAELAPLPDGWSLGGASCDDGSAVNAIGLSPGETVTCTFRNTYQETQGPKGSITIIKDATALVEPDDTLFGFVGTLGAFQLADGGSIVFPELEAGAYTVSELLPEGWDFDRVECIALDYEVGDLSATVQLGEGEAAQCTFYNSEEEEVLGPTGSLTIIKQTAPSGGEGFDFDGGDLGTFTLDDDESVVFSELEAGAYTVAELVADDWAFAGVECTAADWDSSGASVTVNLAEGEAAVCTFTNGQLPYTGPQPFMLPLLIAGLWLVLAGLGLVVWPARRRVGDS